MLRLTLARPPAAGLPGAILALALVCAAYLHWMEAGFLEILPDDVLAISNSREIARGRLGLIWSPLEQHWVPLYRLVRLPFDLHFPESYLAFHALAVAVHLVNVLLLYLLAKRYLGNQWSALAAAVLCAWSRAGVEALIWKISFAYALSWTFVLLGLWCLPRPGRAWGFATFSAVACAVGLFAGSLFALPGFLVTALLAESRAVWRRALAVCLGVGAAGSAAWIGFAGARLPTAGSLIAGDWVGRWLGGVRDGVWASAVHLTLGLPLVPDPWVPWIVFLPALALLWLRRDIPWRPVFGVLAMTMIPLVAILVLRQAPGVWKISRYAYQASFLWYIVLGAVVAAVLRRATNTRWTRVLGVVLGLVAAGLFLGETAAARRSRDSWRAHTVTQWTFWWRWDRLFELISEHRREVGRPLPIPNYHLQLYSVDLHEVFRLCHPFGLPALTIPHHEVSQDDIAEFWHEVDRAARQLPGFNPRQVLAHSSAHSSDSRPRF